MVRIFAAFNSCLQMFLLVLYQSYILQANLNTYIFLWPLSPLLLSAQPYQNLFIYYSTLSPG